DAVEGHLFGARGRGVERDRARHQRQLQVTLPIGARGHDLLLNASLLGVACNLDSLANLTILVESTVNVPRAFRAARAFYLYPSLPVFVSVVRVQTAPVIRHARVCEIPGRTFGEPYVQPSCLCGSKRRDDQD